MPEDVENGEDEGNEVPISTVRVLEFFTLYTNIAPAVPLEDDFVPLYDVEGVVNHESAIPFYERYLFQIPVNMANMQSHRYAERIIGDNNVRIFNGSHCVLREQTPVSNYVHCRFINWGHSSANEVLLPRNALRPQRIFAGRVHSQNIHSLINVDALEGIDADITVDNAYGILFYDRAEPASNVRGILEPNEVFEFEEPEEFLRPLASGAPFSMPFFALKRTNDTERRRFLHFQGENISISRQIRPGYLINQTVICRDVPENQENLGFELIDPDTLLGRSIEQFASYKNYYDLVLLFNDVEFLEEYCWPEHFILTRETGSDRFSFLNAAKDLYEGLQNWIEENPRLSRARDRLLESRLAEGLRSIAEHLPFFNSAEACAIETQRQREEKRRFICHHPLEWDRRLYLDDGDQIPIDTRQRFGLPRSPNPRLDQRFIDMVNAVDIWSGLSEAAAEGASIEGLNLEQNLFWFANPLYFMDFLDNVTVGERQGLLTEPRIRNLLRVQNDVIATPCFLRGTGRGMYRIASRDISFCNHAVFVTVEAVDGNHRQFIGYENLQNRERINNDINTLRRNEPPWDVQTLVQNFRDSLSNFHLYRPSNLWAEILREQARNRFETGIHRISTEDAQILANMGYVVIASWRNMVRNRGTEGAYFGRLEHSKRNT